MNQRLPSRQNRDDDQAREDLAAQAAKLEALAAELRAKLEQRDGPAEPETPPASDARHPADEGPVVLDMTRAAPSPSKPRPGASTRPAERQQSPLQKGSAMPKAGAAPGANKGVVVTDRGKSPASRGKAELDPAKVRLKPEEEPETDTRLKARALAAFKAFHRRFGKGGVVSMVIHAVLLVVLGIATFTVAQNKPPILIEASSSDTDTPAPMQQVQEVKVDLQSEEMEMVTPTSLTSLEVAVDSTPTPPGGASQSDIGQAPAVGSGMSGLTGIGMGNLMSDLPKGPVAPKPTVGTVTFFGVARKGNKFIYIVDNSASMRGPQFEAARAELYRSVSSLSKYQSFYVIYFSDRAYPMFDPEVAEGLLPAEPQNVEKLRIWLSKIVVSKGGRIIDAMDLALKLQPDAIFLLSDGEMSEKTMSRMMSLNAEGKSINTIGFESQEGAMNLKKIADKYNGVFQFFPVLR